MAIFKKLIGSASSRKASVESSLQQFLADDVSDLSESRELSALCWSPYGKLRRDALRLVIFSQGNRLLYDSSTVISVTDRILPDCPRSNCGRFQYLPHAGDTAQMAKMVFGTSSKPDSFKVHTIANTESLMLSRVFPACKSLVQSAASCTSTTTTNDGHCSSCAHLSRPVVAPLPMSASSDSDSHYSTIRSLDGMSARGGRTAAPSPSSMSYASVDPPDGFTRLRNASFQSDAFNAGCALNGSASMSGEFPPMATILPSRLSRARRRQLSLHGLCDEANSSLNGSLLMTARSRLNSCSSSDAAAAASAAALVYSPLRTPLGPTLSSGGGGVGTSTATTSRRTRGRSDVTAATNITTATRHYGVALLFAAEDKDFIFQHILQVEVDTFRLIRKIAAATFQKEQFLKLVYEAWLEFCSTLCLLHNSLRLRTPVWLSLTNSALQDRVVDEFCRTLAKLNAQLNTKDTKFFLSTLISSVLMTHLSWVASIAPPESCSYDRSLLLGTSVIDSRRNPYNAMTAQFLELSGGIGVDNPTARTVVLGVDTQIVAEILFVLSYFIRCSSVENKRREILTPDLLSPLRNFVEKSTIVDRPTATKTNSNGFSAALSIFSATANATTTTITNSETSRGNGIGNERSVTTSSSLSSSSSASGAGAPPPLTSAASAFFDAATPAGGGITSPPVKIRALSLAYNNSSSLLCSSTPTTKILSRQFTNSRCCYELIVDVNQVENYSASATAAEATAAAAATPSDCHLSPGQFSNGVVANSADAPPQSRAHLHLNGLETPSDFGRTLLAGVCSTYLPHFVLSGVDKRRTSFEECYTKIHRDLCMPARDLLPTTSTTDASSSTSAANLSASLAALTATSTNGCSAGGGAEMFIVADGFLSDANSQHSSSAINARGATPAGDASSAAKPSAVVVMADASTYIVKIISGGNCRVEECVMDAPSETIVAMLEEFAELNAQKCAPTFLISFLEDRLGSILARSNVLVNMINGNDETPLNLTTKNGGAQQTYGQDNYHRRKSPADEMLMTMAAMDGIGDYVTRSNQDQTVNNDESESDGVARKIENTTMKCDDDDEGDLNCRRYIESNGERVTSTATNNNTAECSRMDDENCEMASGFISMTQMSRVLDCHYSDLRLILNVAAVFAPGVLSSTV